MILLDWTRMGKTYCLAGAVEQGGQVRVVRPLQARFRKSLVRNVGWSPFLFDGHSRWEVFTLLRPELADPQAPHLEDVWVQDLKTTGRLATPDQRRAVLRATLTPADQPPFGAALRATRTSAFLPPGEGVRSLAGVVVPWAAVSFGHARREGMAEPDFRVKLTVPGLGECVLPLKDHYMLLQAERAGADPDAQAQALTRAVARMGEQVVVRLGLSRAFAAQPGRADGACWLMADGFFSFTDPQP
jgi:hypothetical protein